MAIVELADLSEGRPRDGRLLGLDLGTRTIGMALSDTRWTIATPLDTIRRGKKLGPDLDALFGVIDRHGVHGIVLGLPLNMDGTTGPRAQSTKAFAHNLLKRRDLPLAFWDERLSTAAVERMLTDEADLSRRRRGELVDKAAAAYILQSALDRLGKGSA